MTAEHYFVGHPIARTLRGLAGDATEAEAVERLADFLGTPADVRVAIAMLERAGRSVEADSLRHTAGATE